MSFEKAWTTKTSKQETSRPLNTIIREQYHDTLAQYKKLLKIGYNISTIFIQMNLLTQRSKTFAMSYDKMNAMVNTLVL